jgi:hypothetical protein
VLVFIEPEFGVRDKERVDIVVGVELSIEYREDREKGGYDSYVFAADESHPLWHGIRPEHLKIFNGGYGGEIVSQHTVVSTKEFRVHARCGLGLEIPAVFEIPFGEGAVVVSRLQIRHRLARPEAPSSLFARRIDPVLQQFVLNLVGYAQSRSVRISTSATVAKNG